MTDKDGPEVTRLIRRLADMKTRNFGVLWGDKAAEVSAEDRAREINRALDAIEAGDFDVLDMDAGLGQRPWREVLADWRAR